MTEERDRFLFRKMARLALDQGQITQTRYERILSENERTAHTREQKEKALCGAVKSEILKGTRH